MAATLGLGFGRGGSATPTVTGPTPTFIDETAAGLAHTYGGDFEYSVGGGVAVLDCNGDGRPDLYLAGGSNPAALFENGSPVGGSLRFTAVHDQVTDLTGVEGAYPIDIDGDGQTDLVVLHYGETDLLRGLGGCRFEPANERWTFATPPSWASAFSATWEGSAALPTLAIGSYLSLQKALDGTRACTDDALLRPAASGTGYAPPATLAPGYCTLSMLFSDWDRSGRRDLRVSNDRHYYDPVNGEEQLWRIAAGQTPRLYTAADGWVQMQIEGMGIASQDVTGDGYPDVYMTTQGANRLQSLTAGPDQPTYRDIGLKRDVNATRPFVGGDTLPSTAWHPEFQDVNNDGFVDLYVTKGNVNTEADFATKDPSDLMLGQPDGTFREVADVAGILNFDRGRGAALADFNLDGMLDLVEVNYGAPVRLWRNVGMGSATSPASIGNWLALRFTEPGPNTDAIGSWVEVKVGDTTLRRELTIGGGHAGGQLGWVHFGLGSASGADVRVQWPDGQWGPWQAITANSFDIVQRGAAPQTWVPNQ